MRKNILAQILFENNIKDESTYTFSVLLEDRIDFIKKSFNNKYDPLVDHIAQNIDPTDNKKYTQWLMRRHVAGDSIPSATRLRTALSWYDKAAPKSHVNDINKHTVQSMMDVAHMTRFSPKHSHADETGVEEIYSNNGVKAYHVRDKQTMINTYGGGRKYSSRWCTAADGHDNMFDRYSGGKYTIHYPNGEYMHLHHQSGQAKDPSNTEIDFSSDKRYKPYNEDTNKIMHLTAEKEGVEKDLPERHFGISDEEFDHAWKGYKAHDSQLSSKFLRNAEVKPLSSDQYSDLMGAGWLRKVSNNPNLTEDQVSHFLTKDDWEYSNIISNPAVKGKNADHVVKHILDNKALAYKITGVKHLQSHHVDDLMERANNFSRDHSDALRDLIRAGTYKFTDDQVDKIHDREGVHVALDIASHQPVKEHIRQASIERLKSNVTNGFSRGDDIKSFAKHNEIRDDELHDLISRASRASSSQSVYSKILDIPSLKREHVEHIVHDLKSEKHYHIGNAILKKPALTHDDVESLIVHNPHHPQSNFSEMYDYLDRRDSKAKVAHELAKKSDLHPDDLEQMGYYKKKDLPAEHFTDVEHAPFILKNLQYHPKASYKDINNLLDAKAFTPYTISGTMVKNVLDHPNAGPENVHKILDHWGHDTMVADQVFEHDRTPQSAMDKLHKLHPGRYTPK